jgi:tetraacyldisaccharide 4'-kinase
MLARRLEGTSVLVASDRYLAGRMAEHHFAATVHILDDGFQHFQLDRDVDIVIVGREDIATPRTVPAGRLREPLDTLIAADAILTADPDVRIDAVGVDVPIFTLRRSLGAAQGGLAGGAPAAGPVLAVAGVASPQRFFDDLRAAGWVVSRTLAFRDHHPYSRLDVREIFGTARAAAVRGVVTTEKDYVRLLPHRPFPMPIGWLPLTVEPEPHDAFLHWLAASIGEARDIIVD